MPGPVSQPAPSSLPVPTTARWRPWQVFLAALVVVLAGLAAYSDSFQGKFFLDDLPAIKENPTIQQDWSTALHPPGDGQTVTNRPLVNLSLAANYKWAKKTTGDGFALPGYHALNVAMHLLAGMALLGLVRRTLELPKMRERFADAALPVALMAALLWTVHPLQTGSVTYVVQRAESMMGLFFLVMMYCYVRGITGWPWLWWPLAVIAALASGLCKEVAVTAPVVVLLFDWVFVAEKPREWLRRRWLVYAGLWAVAAFIAWRSLQAGTRGFSAGFGAGVPWYSYALSQYPSILNYLALAAWPHPLALDHGKALVENISEALPSMVVIMVLVAGTVYALARRWAAGFLGAWFFVILAPSSSIVPIVTETAAEHRMYLPLVALTTLAAIGLWQGLGRRALPVALLLAGALGAITFARNRDYESYTGMWGDATAKHPEIARTHENYGIMLFQALRLPESVQEFQTAIRLTPVAYPDCENNLGNALNGLGKYAEAVPHYAKAANYLLRPRDQAIAYVNLGNSYNALGQYPMAYAAYLRATQLRPDYAPAYNNLAGILNQLGKLDEAVTTYQLALKYAPVFPQAEVNLANVYIHQGHPDLAAPHYLNAIQEDPSNASAHYGLGNAFAIQKQYDQAIQQYSLTEQLAPNTVEAHYNHAVCLALLNRIPEAIQEYEETLRINPNYEAARTGLESIRAAAATPAP
jgi:tetratricopeptide (TPR) repeat protein